VSATAPDALGDVAPEDFRKQAHALVDWVADYLADVGGRPVLATVRPGDVAGALPRSAPELPEPFDAVLADVDRIVMPGVTHWQHPGFFAYFAITGSAPGILAELLTAALNVNGMLWRTSPSATELEEVVLDWLRQMIGLGEGWFGMVNDTASISSLLALAAAREAAGLDVRARGTAGRPDLPVLRVYCSEQAHSSVDKAAITLGIGSDNVVHVGTDDAYRMRADLFAEAVRRDRAAGRHPLAVVATTGTTSTTSIDPVPAIADIAGREGLWLHVDGAYGGVAAVVPELRHVLDGVDRADSLVVNPHKWLFTPIDLSAFWTRHPQVLERAFALVPDYLTTAEQGSVTDYMNYGVQLGRRFRSLKLWMVLRAFGTRGVEERIRRHCAMARDLAALVEAEPGWELAAPVPLSTVCLRWVGDGSVRAERADAANAAAVEHVNASGEAFLATTRLRGRTVVRVAIGSLRTQWSHVERAWDLLREGAATAS
jgi:aromatic-L-amino-acid decarboxylase